jgi:SAM-dependent methyltransferase
MRRVARLNVAACPNVRLLDVADPGMNGYDVILVNSVVQYMREGELSSWLRRWRDMLHPDGRIVVSDVLPPGLPAWRESVEYLFFHLRRGLLGPAVRQAWREVRRYAGLRSSSPLAQLRRQDLERQAAAAGLAVEVLGQNLTYHRGRLSAVLRRAAPDPTVG